MKKLLLTGIALVGAALVFAQPRLVAHRGFYTTPGSDENTISSLINAQQLGVYGVEFDVNRTSDGELIVVHGPKVGDRRAKGHVCGDQPGRIAGRQSDTYAPRISGAGSEGPRNEVDSGIEETQDA